MTDKRLIEEAFPLKQASLNSVHEKNVRHGHISTLHIWPARRPLAACRAALIAALLPDPGTAEARAEMVRRIGGEVVTVHKSATSDAEAKTVEETVGGILHWEGDPKNDKKRQQEKARTDAEMARFREEIRAAYGGRAPRVLDMFAGGGAIPLEAMRLGCDVTAIDYNPVAWFLLKCTLEYPQKLAGKKWPLPAQAQGSEPSLMPKQGTLALEGTQRALGEGVSVETGDLAAHVRWWGNWVLERARRDLASYYPTLPLNPDEPESDTNPLCPTVAYLWARTVPHPDARLAGLRVPILKTLWLCKKAGKKRALRIIYNAHENRFDFEVFTPQNDSEVGPGTMSRTGVQCPPTGDGKTDVFLRSDYLQSCGKNGQIGSICTAVIVDVPQPPKHPSHVRAARLQAGTKPGKEYRLPRPVENSAAERVLTALDALGSQMPHGLPCEPIDPPDSRAIFVHLYGLDTFGKLFTARQLLTLGTFVLHTRSAHVAMQTAYNAVSPSERSVLSEALAAYLYCVIAKGLDYNNVLCSWYTQNEQITHLFKRYALPMMWDFAEANFLADTSGGYEPFIDWIVKAVQTTIDAAHGQNVEVVNSSAVSPLSNEFDAIVTDPPYYDAIPYADLSDFFYVWLRRTVGDAYGATFAEPLAPKPGELVQHAGRHASKEVAKQFYEDGMAQAFGAACRALKPDGRMVIVFAHKTPDAWETLTAAMIRAGFVVTASWPIDTEMGNRARAQNSAALSSSVWLVCRKRPTDAGKGWYKQVQPRMKERITERLRYFWDIGIRGPDFLWAAIGPGLEAFSTYDEVRRNNGDTFTVSEFLKEVRRITTDFALGQIVDGGTEGLDEWTRYALMHQSNFGVDGAPVGECILLAGAYGLDLGALTGPRGILGKAKSKPAPTSDDAPDAPTENDETGSGSGSELRLLRWDERKRDDLGEPHPTGGLLYIDLLHRLVREWAGGDVNRVAEYAARHGLGDNDLFWRVAQAFAEMHAPQSRERTMLEAVIAWGRGRNIIIAAPTAKPETMTLDYEEK